MTLSKSNIITAAGTVAALGLLLAAPALAAGGSTPFEASVLGGVQGLMQNDTGVNDNFVNVPVAVAFAYHTPTLLAVEGEFTWLIPVQNSVEIGTGGSQDLKNPDVLIYQVNLRADVPLRSTRLSPYATAGLGAMTFLSATDPDRSPQLADSETAFAVNFGAGATFPLVQSLAVRADFREFVAFPKNDAAGLSNSTGADPIWMPRGTLGLSYHF